MSEQFALFADQAPGPAGLRYVDAFVSPSDEQEMIARISALPLQPFQFGAYEGKRRVASFGLRYDYTLRRMQDADPIPDWLSPIVKKVEAFGRPRTRIAQVLCTEYDVGVGIGWHRDKPQFGMIFGLSLGSTCRFRFRRANGTTWDRFALEARPRSLYMMSGAARDVWQHSIPAVAARRYSVTFRTMANREP